MNILSIPNLNLPSSPISNKMVINKLITVLICLNYINAYEEKLIKKSFQPCSKKFEIITDFTHGDCKAGYFYQKTGNPIHGCFPTCVKDFGSEIPCNPNPCPPGYYCPKPNEPNEETYCQLDQNSCFKHHIEDAPGNNPWKEAWKPKCLPDGTWAPKQCKGEANNGRCFCYDPIGNRIFGQAFVETSNNMTCACSRRRVDLIQKKGQFYTTLHCDNMGNYEPLQCDSGQCWCVEIMTGDITSKVVPEEMLKLLPCYDAIMVGEQYLRKCESEEFAQKKILNDLKIHGTNYVNFPHIMCDGDGSYGPYQIINGQAFCKWRDNSNIHSYSTPVDHDISLVDCNCARDIKIYEAEALKQNLLCLQNGNYKPQQQQNNGKWYCVDSDGFRSSHYFDKLPDCTIYI